MRTLGSWIVVLSLAPRLAMAQPEEPSPTPPTPEPTPAPEPAPEPVPEPAPVAPPAPPPPPAVIVAPVTPLQPVPERRDPVAPSRDGFRFGSYGRIVAGTDLRGGKPESANVVAHGPRIIEKSYLELETSYGFTTDDGRFLRPIVTLAFDDTLFHDTGEFDAHPALRNMFLEAEVTPKLYAWVGSRMYRGDDIYLFDYWPLDDLNTIGGGVSYRALPALEVAGHVGVNRLDNDFQFQETEIPDPAQGSRTVLQLDRQRLVASANATYLLLRAPEQPSFKFKLHAEVHGMAAGERERSDGSIEELARDVGYLVGAEAGAFGLSTDPRFRRHLNLFVRYATGLAAADELAPPTTIGVDGGSSDASELTFGLAGNWDHQLGNVMLGALSRRFVDADGNDTDFDDGWEYAVNARPLARVARGLFAGADLSYQARFPRGLNALTQTAADPAVFQIAPMLVFSPVGPSAYDRPQLRIVYRAAHANRAARDLFAPDDVRGDYAWTHFLGVQAEWWFNSSTYR